MTPTSEVGVHQAAGRRALLAGTAHATRATAKDVALLQTAAGIENLAVSLYGELLGLPLVTGGRSFVQDFATTARAQHADQAQAFNTAAARAGGAAQTLPDPALLATVRAATLTTVDDVVQLALAVEDRAAQTFTNDTTLASTPELRSLLVSVAAVAAQRVAVLRTTAQLLAAGLAADALAQPGPSALTALPAAVGAAGATQSFVPTAAAALPTEGATS